MFSSRIEAGPESTDVGTMQWAMSQTGILESVGLGPCIGVAVYDSAGTGYLCHSASIGEFADQDEHGELTEMLTVIKESQRDPTGLHAWVGGCEINLSHLQPDEDHDEYYAFMMTKRSLALAELVKLGIAESQVEVRWLQAAESLDMELDCNTGQCTMTVDSNPEWLSDY